MRLASLIVPTLLCACSAASNIQEDLTFQEPPPSGNQFAGEAARDFTNTGVGITPLADHVIAPARLVVANRSNEAIVCEVWEDDYCPSLGNLLDGLARLETGAVWAIDDVQCTILDVACLRASDDPATAVPLRTWTWFVQPDDSE